MSEFNPWLWRLGWLAWAFNDWTYVGNWVCLGGRLWMRADTFEKLFGR